MLIIITLAYAAMRKKEHAATSPLNKAELYLKYWNLMYLGRSAVFAPQAFHFEMEVFQD